MRNFFKSFFSIIIGIVVGLIIGEIVLRIYNPLPSRVHGNQIQLKTNLKRVFPIKPPIRGLDSTIYYSSNSLGFRGEEKPADFDHVFSIIAVGGSTTECSLLSDNQTWAFKLNKSLKESYNNVWVNNAGIDGCSTYGHNILLQDYILKLKPKMVLFLIGANDRAKSDFKHENGFLIDRPEPVIATFLKKNSELANLINNLYISYLSRKAYVGINIKKKKHFKTIEERRKYLKQYVEDQPVYKSRVELLVKKCKDNNIIPVLITQPLLTDSVGLAGMDIYNNTVKQICAEQHILCIDLSKEMEKDSAYFYDRMHYTIKGCTRVSEIISTDLKEYFETNKATMKLNK